MAIIGLLTKVPIITNPEMDLGFWCVLSEVESVCGWFTLSDVSWCIPINRIKLRSYNERGDNNEA
jgi:hypothetical protein